MPCSSVVPPTRLSASSPCSIRSCPSPVAASQYAVPGVFCVGPSASRLPTMTRPPLEIVLCRSFHSILFSVRRAGSCRRAAVLILRSCLLPVACHLTSRGPRSPVPPLRFSLLISAVVLSCFVHSFPYDFQLFVVSNSGCCHRQSMLMLVPSVPPSLYTSIATRRVH
jgi:hypothetical protein